MNKERKTFLILIIFLLFLLTVSLYIIPKTSDDILLIRNQHGETSEIKLTDLLLIEHIDINLNQTIANWHVRYKADKGETLLNVLSIQQIISLTEFNNQSFDTLYFDASDGASRVIDSRNSIILITVEKEKEGLFLRVITPEDTFSQKWLKNIVRITFLMNCEIDIESLNLRFNENHILKDVNLKATKGSITILKGKNGSGKTSCLHCLCGIIPKYFQGTIDYKKFILPQKSNSSLFGYLMQEPDKQICFPFIEEELCFGAENLKRDINDFKIEYNRLLNIFPILRNSDIETNSLSFGQKKVLLFASIILKDPDIFLLDEPSAGLSDDLRQKIKFLVTDLKNKNKIIVIAEHDNYFNDIADGFIEL